MDALDPTRILNHAKGFRLAGRRCEEQRPLSENSIQMLPVQAVPIYAFAIELALKTMYVINGQKVIRGHDLYKIYKSLPEKDMNIISNRFNKSLNTIDFHLNDLKAAFLDWRYIYEKDSAHVDLSFLRDFLDVVLDITEEKIKKTTS